MKIYQMTAAGEAEASSPTAEPSDARRVLYYLRKRSNGAASDDMIAEMVFGGDRGQTHVALSKLIRANAVRSVG